MRLAKPFPVGLLGVGAGVSPGLKICLALCVSAALAVGGASASTPPLPPLPAGMPLDGAVMPADPPYSAPSLPREVTADVLV